MAQARDEINFNDDDIQAFLKKANQVDEREIRAATISMSLGLFGDTNSLKVQMRVMQIKTFEIFYTLVLYPRFGELARRALAKEKKQEEQAKQKQNVAKEIVDIAMDVYEVNKIANVVNLLQDQSYDARHNSEKAITSKSRAATILSLKKYFKYSENGNLTITNEEVDKYAGEIEAYLEQQIAQDPDISLEQAKAPNSKAQWGHVLGAAHRSVQRFKSTSINRFPEDLRDLVILTWRLTCEFDDPNKEYHERFKHDSARMFFATQLGLGHRSYNKDATTDADDGMRDSNACTNGMRGYMSVFAFNFHPAVNFVMNGENEGTKLTKEWQNAENAWYSTSSVEQKRKLFGGLNLAPHIARYFAPCNGQERKPYSIALIANLHNNGKKNPLRKKTIYIGKTQDGLNYEVLNPQGQVVSGKITNQEAKLYGLTIPQQINCMQDIDNVRFQQDLLGITTTVKKHTYARRSEFNKEEAQYNRKKAFQSIKKLCPKKKGILLPAAVELMYCIEENGVLSQENQELLRQQFVERANTLKTFVGSDETKSWGPNIFSKQKDVWESHLDYFQSTILEDLPERDSKRSIILDGFHLCSELTAIGCLDNQVDEKERLEDLYLEFIGGNLDVERAISVLNDFIDPMSYKLMGGLSGQIYAYCIQNNANNVKIHFITKESHDWYKMQTAVQRNKKGEEEVVLINQVNRDGSAVPINQKNDGLLINPFSREPYQNPQENGRPLVALTLAVLVETAGPNNKGILLDNILSNEGFDYDKDDFLEEMKTQEEQNILREGKNMLKELCETPGNTINKKINNFVKSRNDLCMGSENFLKGSLGLTLGWIWAIGYKNNWKRNQNLPDDVLRQDNVEEEEHKEAEENNALNAKNNPNAGRQQLQNQDVTVPISILTSEQRFAKAVAESLGQNYIPQLSPEQQQEMKKLAEVRERVRARRARERAQQMPQNNNAPNQQQQEEQVEAELNQRMERMRQEAARVVQHHQVVHGQQLQQMQQQNANAQPQPQVVPPAQQQMQQRAAALAAQRRQAQIAAQQRQQQLAQQQQAQQRLAQQQGGQPILNQQRLVQQQRQQRAAQQQAQQQQAAAQAAQQRAQQQFEQDFAAFVRQARTVNVSQLSALRQRVENLENDLVGLNIPNQYQAERTFLRQAVTEASARGGARSAAATRMRSAAGRF